MRIGILGNMNNNGFSIFRYFLYLGYDAHLLLYDTDGKGSLRHFSVEKDTWDYTKYKNRIIRLNFSGSEFSALNPVDWFASKLLNPIRSLVHIARFQHNFVRKSTLMKSLSQFDVVIGSGIAPALFERADLKLDIFYPYSTGIEFFSAQEFTLKIQKSSRLKKKILKNVKNLQEQGLKNTTLCINTEFSLTKAAFDEMGIVTSNRIPPIIFNLEKAKETHYSKELRYLVQECKKREFNVISQARLLWVNKSGYPETAWARETKNNDWIIKGFQTFLKNNHNVNAALILFEYGPDVEETKSLIKALDIEDHVIWAPVMSRKEILCLMDFCHAGIGELVYDKTASWGGAGWEILSKGLPFLTSFNFSDKEFKDSYGFLKPPLFEVNKISDITKHLTIICKNNTSSKRTDRDTGTWFEKNMGIGAAKNLADIVDKIYKDKTDHLK